MRKILCIGHRGASGLEPENTLRSFRRALELGVDAIELDVQLCDGELVVIHDRRVDRTTNGRGRVARKTFAALRALDAGKGEQIPTLREVFAAVDRRAWINVELKGRGTAHPVAKLVKEFVEERGWRYADFLVSSFHRKELLALAGSAIPLGILFARGPRRLPQRVSEIGAGAVHVGLRHLPRGFIAKAHELGVRVFVFTVNHPADFRRMREAGVDGVFTDFPDRVGSLQEAA